MAQGVGRSKGNTFIDGVERSIDEDRAWVAQGGLHIDFSSRAIHDQSVENRK